MRYMIKLNAFPSSPSPESIQTARTRAGLSQEAAAALIYKQRLAWTRYELGSRDMDPALWELWKIKAALLK